MRCVAVAAAAVFAAPATGHAEDIRERPLACKPVMAIQFHGCQMRKLYRCDLGEAKVYDRYETYDSAGLSQVTHENANHDLKGLDDLRSNYKLVAVPTDKLGPALAEVLRGGSGAYSFDFSAYEGTKMSSQQVAGVLISMGETVTVSGIALQVFLDTGIVDYSGPYAPFVYAMKFYRDPARDAYFQGEQVGGTDFDAKALPISPVTITLPDDPGFKSSIPTVDCAH